MNFLLSLCIIFILYLILFIYSFTKETINEPYNNFIDKLFGYIDSNITEGRFNDIFPSFLFCIIYHFFIAIVTFGNANFFVYFAPCFIIILIMFISTNESN